MISLDVLITNFWENLHCSNTRFRLFTRDMAQRIKLSGVPELVALLTDTNPIIDTYSDQIDLIASNMLAQKLSTYSKNQVLIQFQEEVRGLEGAVIDVFKGKKSMQYTVEFFPHNRGEYTKLTEVTAEGLFKRTQALTLKYVTELGAPRQLTFQTLLTDYTSNYEQQELAKANVETGNNNIKKVVQPVKSIMFRNILKVAAYYYLTPGDVKNFYKETYLHCRHKTSKGVPIEAAYKKDIAKESILLADISCLPTESLLFESLGKDSLWIFYSDTILETPIVPQDATELLAGEELLVEGTKLKEYIYIANKSTLAIGKIHISLI